MPASAAAMTPAAGPDFDRHRRHPQRLTNIDHTAARSHDEQPRQPELRDRALEPMEITGKQRADIGADRCRAGALELPDLGQHLTGKIDADPRQRLSQSLAYAPFVHVVEEREQTRHRDRIEPGVPDPGDHRINVGFLERGDHVSLRIDALGDLVTPASRHQHRRRVLKQVVKIGAGGSAQFEHVAEPPCRHKSGPGALLLGVRW